MKTLITPSQVIGLAFADSPGVSADKVGEAVIISAQQKFIRPTLGDLYERLEKGELPSLLEGHIRPALAHYVKCLVLPTLAAPAGDLGVIRTKGGSFSPADAATLTALRRSARSAANAIMRAAIEHIEANPTLYPEYRPQDNAMRRVSVASQIVL